MTEKETTTERRVLVTDDDVVNRQVIKHILASLGYGVKTVKNGLETLEILRQETFDLVLMDIQMPEIDGFQTTRLIRAPKNGALNPKIPIIAFTAHGLTGFEERCQEAGMNDHISKPFQIPLLKKLLDRWLTSTKNSDHPPEAEEFKTAIDFETLSTLKKNTGVEFEGLLNLFLVELAEKIDRLELAFENDNSSEVEGIIHKLKSNGGTFGALELVEICIKLEEAHRTREGEKQDELLSTLRSVVGNVSHVIREKFL